VVQDLGRIDREEVARPEGGLKQVDVDGSIQFQLGLRAAFADPQEAREEDTSRSDER